MICCSCSCPSLLEPSDKGSWVNPERAEGADDGEPSAPRLFIEGLLVVSENDSSFPDGHVPGGPASEFFLNRFHVI